MELVIDEKTYKVKDFLTTSDFRALIKVTMEAFINGQMTTNDKYLVDGISGYMGNPGCAYDEFCRSLGNLCIEGFDNELHEKIFALGEYEDLMHKIKNAMTAYGVVNANLERYFTLSNSLNQFLTLLAQKFPDEKALDKMLKKIPKEWNKVFKEYQSIIKPNE